MLIVREIKTEINIESSANRVWKILTDFERYAEWNPFIKCFSDEARVGAKLQTFIQPLGASGRKFNPIVLAAEENKEFRWLGKVFTSGLFDGEHSYVIEKISENKIRFVHSEKFTGLPVSLLGGTLKGAEQGFGLMNQALKERAEKQKAD